MVEVEEKSINGIQRNTFHIRSLLQYCIDACCEQTCERQVQLGAVQLQLKKTKTKDAESREAGDYLRTLSKITKSQMVVGAAAIIAAATGGYFYAKR